MNLQLNLLGIYASVSCGNCRGARRAAADAHHHTRRRGECFTAPGPILTHGKVSQWIVVLHHYKNQCMQHVFTAKIANNVQYLGENHLGCTDFPSITPRKGRRACPGTADTQGPLLRAADGITSNLLGALPAQMGLRARISSIRLCKFT